MAKQYLLSFGVLALLCTTAFGCGEGGDGATGGVACTEEARSSVTVTVKDGAGALVTDATVTYAVDGGMAKACDNISVDGTYVCGYEEEGAFVVTATKGAMMATQNLTIGKTADGCHVDGQTITLTLM